jgi:flavin-dependent dehydrogenase
LIEPSTTIADSFPCPISTNTAHSEARKADMTWRVVTECSGSGYFIAGDAAAVMDPTSSHGVLRALMSGMYAAQTIICSMRYGRAINNQSVYKSWLTNWFEADSIALRRTYLLLNY